MHEQVRRPIVLPDATFPPELQDLALHLSGGEADDAKVDRVAERRLAMRRNAVPLLAEHLVQLGTAIARYELEPRPRVANGNLPQQLEQTRVERHSRGGGPVGQRLAKAIEARLVAGKRDRF